MSCINAEIPFDSKLVISFFTSDEQSVKDEIVSQ